MIEIVTHAITALGSGGLVWAYQQYNIFVLKREVKTLESIIDQEKKIDLSIPPAPL